MSERRGAFPDDVAVVKEVAVIGGVVGSENERHAVGPAAAEATAALAKTTVVRN